MVLLCRINRGNTGIPHVFGSALTINLKEDWDCGKPDLIKTENCIATKRYGDWPVALDAKPFDQPDWMLLSYGKKVRVSSGRGAEHITDENIRTFWKAGSCLPGAVS